VLEQHPGRQSLYDALRRVEKPTSTTFKGSESKFPEDANIAPHADCRRPLPYGLTDNMPSIEAMLTYGLQQGLIPKHADGRGLRLLRQGLAGSPARPTETLKDPMPSIVDIHPPRHLDR